MQKKHIREGLSDDGNFDTTNFIFIRKLIVIFILAWCLQLSAKTYAQSVSFSGKNVPLKQVFTEVEKQTGYLFFFDAASIRKEDPVTLTASKMPLRDFLNRLLQGRALKYMIEDKVITISPKLPDPEDKEKKIPSGESSSSPSQVERVTGKILDDVTGNPLAGASVAVKDSKQVTTTDGKGVFSLSVTSLNIMVVASYVGYETQELRVKRNEVTIRLIPKASILNETVVTGIVSRKAGTFTGAVTSFSNNDLRSIGNQNIFQSLKALDPSFQILDNISAGSNPNLLPNVQIRGASNLPDLTGKYMANINLPLFILDGFEVSLQRVFDLDMNRVERITLLKDATATALYGSRSANGVVVIQTKAPEPGQMKISYTGDFTFELPDLSDYHLLNSAQKLEIEKASGLYTSTLSPNPITQQLLDEQYNARLKEVQRGVNTDWLAQPVQTGFGHRNSLYLEGGDDAIRYGVDMSYNSVSGVMKGSGRETYSGGMTLSYRYKNILFRNYLSVTGNRSDNSPYGTFSEYVKMNPYWRPRDSDGNVLKIVEDELTPGSSTSVTNPLYNSTIGVKNYSQYMQVNDNFSMDWRITPALRFRTNASLQAQRSEANIFYPADYTAFANYPASDYLRRGSFLASTGKSRAYELSSYLDYNKLFAEKHLLYVTGGLSLGDNADNNVDVSAEGFPSQLLSDIRYAYQYQSGTKPTGDENASRRLSALANVNYSYDNRYLLDLSFSTDGSSRFGSNNRFAPFWAVGAGWNIHNEKWAREWNVNFLKIRGSYGSTGTQNFPSYQALTTYSYQGTNNYLNGIGATLLGLGNSNLKWQQKKTLNLGLDMTILKERLSLTANYYFDKTQNQLIDLSIPPSLGFTSYKENLGEVHNKGYEVNLRLVVLKNATNGFQWSVNGSLFHNENKLTKISNALQSYNNRQNASTLSSPTLLYKEGQSMSSIWAVRSLGIDPATGKEVFLTQANERTFVWNAADKVVVGNSLPNMRGMFGTNLMYKGFSLGATFAYQLGGQIYNQTLVDRVENVDIRYNVDQRVYDGRWRQPGDVTFFKNIADASVTMPSSRFVQDNNELTCESISLQYDFQKTPLIKRLPVKTLRLSFYMNQPFRISSVQQERGLSYPFAKTYSFSVQTSF